MWPSPPPAALAPDPAGQAYITGDTASTDFPVTPGAAPGYVSGLLQVNMQVPTTINFGNLISLSLAVGNYTSQLQVSIAAR